MIGFINFNGGQYLLNGKDLYTEYGIIISAGKSDLLQYPSTKERFSNDWPDQNGKEYDLNAPVYFEDPKITLKGVMFASNESEFKTKRYNLFLELKKIGLSILRSIDLSKDFNVLYEESAQGNRNVIVKGTSLKAWELSLQFQTVGYVDTIESS